MGDDPDNFRRWHTVGAISLEKQPGTTGSGRVQPGIAGAGRVHMGSKHSVGWLYVHWRWAPDVYGPEY